MDNSAFECDTWRITEKELSECPQYTFHVYPLGIIEMPAVLRHIKLFHIKSLASKIHVMD